MPTQTQFRRGNTTQVQAFTGAPGEIVVDTTRQVLVVQDGVTPGGFPQASLQIANTVAQTTAAVYALAF
jgi:hypothetical protein